MTSQMWLKQLRMPSQNEQAVNHHFGAEAFSEAPVQQPTPQFDSSMFEKAPISSAQGFEQFLIQQQLAQQINLFFNLILPIVAIALSVIFAVLAWFVGPAWLFIILTVLAVAVAVVSLVFSLKSSKKLKLSIIATGVAGLMLFVSIGGLIFQISQNASNNTSSSKTSKVADKDDDADKKMMTAIQNLTLNLIQR